MEKKQLVIDRSAVYEVDEKCIEKKKNRKQERESKKKDDLQKKQ